MSDDDCEVFAGSANVVEGPSIENMSFRKLSRAEFQKRYLDKLNVKLPAKPPVTKSFTLVRKTDGRWSATDRLGDPIP